MANILIIDDVESIALLLSKFISLKFPNQSIDICYDPQCAINLYREKKYDIVITDDNLNDEISGEKLYYILKPMHPAIFICVTGKGRNKYPFDDLLIKTVGIQEMTNVLSKYISS